MPGVAHASPDAPLRRAVLPSLDTGWQGRPALSGHRADGSGPRSMRMASAPSQDGPHSVEIALTDGELEVVLGYRLTEEGLLIAEATVTNTGSHDYQLSELSVALPLAESAAEVLDFGGHWLTERTPQRWPVNQGAILRESRHGRPGHDSAYLVAAGSPAFSFRSGEVWAAHLGWSGSQRAWVDRQASGIRYLGLGELLAPGEVVLRPGESYTTPTVYASYSAEGLDGISDRYHRYLRRSRRPRSGVRPVILNTWEATYFRQDPARLMELVDQAAAIGVERFVLDDGWMTGRVDDRHGLGDWAVDVARWPQGLAPLIERVHEKGMDFGLWVEPEMANPESEVLREHPEWVLVGSRDEPPLLARHQVVVDLSQQAAFDFVLNALDRLLRENAITYLKWDHNRDLFSSRSHEQTLAAYRLMERLAERHPEVEIESCASGGGRIDFGILQRTSRVWASDTNDPLERQRIYRWSSLLLPPELLGVHLGGARSATTSRTHSLSFRLATTLFGWAGIEVDLTALGDDDRAAVARWLSVYQELRPLLHSGTVVRADRWADATWLHGVVAPDRRDAIFAIVAMELPADAVEASLRFPGLNPADEYELTIVDVGAAPAYAAIRKPEWVRAGGAVLTGAALASIGIPAPPLAPEQALVVRLRAR